MSVSKMIAAIAGLSLIYTAALADDTQSDSDLQIDLFAGMAPIEDDAMIDLRGGSDSHDDDFIDLDIGDIEITSAENNANNLANVSRTVVIGADTGLVSGNTQQNNSGISTFMANSGNNVNFQHTVQVNVYTH